MEDDELGVLPGDGSVFHGARRGSLQQGAEELNTEWPQWIDWVH